MKARVDPTNVFGNLYTKMCPVPARAAAIVTGLESTANAR